MDAQTRERGPSAEKPRQPERGPDQQSQPDRASSPQQETEPKPSTRDRLREHWMLAAAGACLVLLAIIGGVSYWLNIRHYESTDDAFIAARSFAVASKVGGDVVEVAVTDNQHVDAGDLLARIDERDYKIAVDQASAQVAVADANIANVQAQIDNQQEQINCRSRSPPAAG